MKTCPFCAEEIQDAAIVCKHCGRDLKPVATSIPVVTQAPVVPQKKGSWAFRILTGLLLLVFAGWCASAMDPSSSSRMPSDRRVASDSSSASQPTAADRTQAVTAWELAAAYAANEVAADERYKGKNLMVDGMIDNIGKDILDTPYITFQRNSDSFMTVQAMFAKDDAPRLAALTKNTAVIVLCRGGGKFGNVLLRECSLFR